MIHREDPKAVIISKKPARTPIVEMDRAFNVAAAKVMPVKEKSSRRV